MLRSSFYSAGVVLLGATAFAQGNLSGQARPITAPVKYAGVYHLGTGTWTQGPQGTAGVAAAGIIYDNTCNTGYYGGIQQNAIFIDEGRLPGTSSVVRGVSATTPKSARRTATRSTASRSRTARTRTRRARTTSTSTSSTTLAPWRTRPRPPPSR
jgi:hypothetical protein